MSRWTLLHVVVGDVLTTVLGRRFRGDRVGRVHLKRIADDQDIALGWWDTSFTMVLDSLTCRCTKPRSEEDHEGKDEARRQGTLYSPPYHCERAHGEVLFYHSNCKTPGKLISRDAERALSVRRLCPGGHCERGLSRLQVPVVPFDTFLTN